MTNNVEDIFENTLFQNPLGFGGFGLVLFTYVPLGDGYLISVTKSKSAF